MSNPNPPVTPAADPVQQVINDVQQTAQTAATGGIPLEVKLDTGQVYRGNTPQELLDVLKRSQEEASRTITASRAEMEQMRNELAQLKQQSRPQVPDDGKTQEYYANWSKDPSQANLQLLGQSLGIDPNMTGTVLKSVIEEAITGKASREFVNRCPDFPASPETGKLMKERLAAKFGSDLGAVTADNLEITYHQLVREGRIQPRAMAATDIQSANVPIPNLRGNSAPPNPMTDVLAQAQAMPLDQLKQVIETLSARTRG